MTRVKLLAFLRAQPWAVEATVRPDGGPQAAVIGVAVTDELELIIASQNGSTVRFITLKIASMIVSPFGMKTL